jgi:hypothetical protein
MDSNGARRLATLNVFWTAAPGPDDRAVDRDLFGGLDQSCCETFAVVVHQE